MTAADIWIASFAPGSAICLMMRFRGLELSVALDDNAAVRPFARPLDRVSIRVFRGEEDVTARLLGIDPRAAELCTADDLLRVMLAVATGLSGPPGPACEDEPPSGTALDRLREIALSRAHQPFARPADNAAAFSRIALLARLAGPAAEEE